MNAEKLKGILLEIIEDKKAKDINVIDLKDKTYLADYYIVASANSQRQLFAIAEFLRSEVKGMGKKCYVEGESPCDWVIVDAGDVIVHLFKTEARTYYSLDKMWDFIEKGSKSKSE